MKKIISLSTAASPPIPIPEANHRRKFLPTSYTNIKRDSVSGMLYVVAKVCGMKMVKSLKTRALTIAKPRADEKIKNARESWQHKSKRPDIENWKMKQLADFWEADMKANPDLKQTTKTHRTDLLKIIRDNWPGMDTLKPARVTINDCEEWRRRMIQAKYSASTINHSIGVLRAIFNAAIERGICFNNPSVEHQGKMTWIKDPPKSRALPSDALWAQMLKRLRARPDRRRAYFRLRVLAYSGQRPLSISSVRPKDVDLKNNTIKFPPIKHNDDWNEIPLNRQLRVVVKTLLRLHPGGDRPLVPIESAARALKAVCEEVKFKELTGARREMIESDFRHFFTTRAFERGVSDVAVGAMRGDKDAGKTARRIYTQFRRDHLEKESKKL